MQASTQVSGVDLYAGPLFAKRQKRAASWKTCKYLERGHWLGRHRLCETWHYAAQLCYQLQFESNKMKWQLSDSYGQPGCDIKLGHSPVRWQRLPVSNWRSGEPPSISQRQVCLSQGVDRQVCCRPHASPCQLLVQGEVPQHEPLVVHVQAVAIRSSQAANRLELCMSAVSLSFLCTCCS